ncbi:MAG TPA: PAS domain S-box protein [Cyclobacteriaceae bacterium]|nr:PAS domain S-box protein [Cyclobacteriaceae bacterium]
MSTKSILDRPRVKAPRKAAQKSAAVQQNGHQKSQFSIDEAPDASLIIDKTGSIIQANSLASRLFGYSKTAIKGKNIELLIPEIHKKLSNGKPFFHHPKQRRVNPSSNLFALQKNGNKFMIDLSVGPVHFGKAIYSWVSIRRPPLQEFTDDGARVAQAYSRSLIEAALDPLVTISPEGKITDVNEASVKATGMPREKLIGTDFSDYFTEPKKAREGYKQVFAKGFVADYPLTIRDRNGKLTDVLYNASVYRDDFGIVRGVLAAARDITQVKQTSQYARSLIEASLDPLVTINPEGKITDVNEASVRATGVPRQKLIGTDFSDYFTEPQKAREAYEQVFAKGYVADYALTIRDTKGKLTDVLYNATVYKDSLGSVLGALATARDVTQLKRTSEYARSLIEASLDPLVTINPEGKITDVNEALVRATGQPREKLIGTDFSDYFTEPQKAREGYQQVFAKGSVSDLPLKLRDKKGKLTDVLYNATVYKDNLGSVLGALATSRDITQLKRTSEYARSLIEASLDPLVTVNPEGKITDVNEALVRATGVQREKLIGTDFSDYFTEPQRAREGYQQVFAKGSVSDLPLKLRDTKGKLTDVLYNATVYKDNLGNVLGALATSRDITQLKRTSEYARSLIEASLDPLVTINPEGKITDVNEALVRATGVPREKLIGTDFSDYFTEPQRAREGYQQVFAKGSVSDLPLKLRDTKGKLTDVLYNATVYRDNLGNVIGALATSRDITQLKRTSEYARSLIEASLDPLVTINPEGKITDVNEALVRATGVPREKLIGTDFSDYFTEPQRAREGYQQVFAKGSVSDLPLKLRDTKGKVTDVLYNATVYKDNLGNVLGALATSRDITELKRTAEYARSLIEASLDPLVTVNPEGKITDVNEASVKATGVARDVLIGTDFSDYFTEPQKAREGYKLVFAKGQVSDYPLTLRNKNGQLIQVLFNASVYRDEKGSVLGAVAAARDVTLLKQTEENIRKIQAYTRSLIETSLDPQITKGPDGRITDVNEATVQVTGVPREKLIGTHFPDYFTEPVKAEEAYREAFYKGVVRNYPLAIRHKNGKITDVLYNATVFKDEEGVVQGVFASARDITDRKQAEEELQRQQVYTRSLIEASLDPMVAISPAGKITDVNEALVKATGVKRDKLIGTDFSDYFTEPDKARDGYQKVFAEGFVADLPLTIRHNTRDVLYNASVYKDEKGKVLGVFASARDITDRKQAEEEIKKQQAYTRSLIEASLDPMVAISPEGKITDVNEALVKATGVERSNLIDTDFSDYFTEPDKAREGYQQIFAKGFVADSPLTIRHNLRDVLYNASVYRDEKGKVLGAFASARDITAQRKQEVRIKTLNEELEQRIIELESFSYSVSHDLRAPLRGIDGFIAIFLTRYLEKVDTEGQRLLGNVRRNVNKMGSLIDELLTLSRIGMKDIQITTINMNELVHTVVDELVEMKGKSIVKVHPLEKAQGDNALIKQVLVNLISNAFKYSTKKENPVIEIGSKSDDGEIQYYIKDNGVGFDMEYSNKLFGVFQRLHDPQEYQGTGVGLAIVKRIIIRHGGRVWAEGKEGVGATFYFSLKSH